MKVNAPSGDEKWEGYCSEIIWWDSFVFGYSQIGEHFIFLSGKNFISQMHHPYSLDFFFYEYIRTWVQLCCTKKIIPRVCILQAFHLKASICLLDSLWRNRMWINHEKIFHKINARLLSLNWIIDRILENLEFRNFWRYTLDIDLHTN